MRIETKSAATALRFHADGRLSVFTADGFLHLFNGATATASHNTGRTPARCRLSDDARFAGLASDLNPVIVHDSTTGRKISQTPAPSAPLSGLGFSPDGSRMLYATRDALLHCWSLESGRMLWSTTAGIGEVWGIRFSPDGSRIFATNMDANVRTHNAANGELTAINDSMPISHFDAVYSSDGRSIASGGAARQVHVFSSDGLKLQRTFRREADPINQLSISPDGKLLAVSLFQELSHRNPTYLVVYDFASGEVVREITTPSAVLDMDFAPDSRQLAYSLRGGGIQITSL